MWPGVSHHKAMRAARASIDKDIAAMTDEPVCSLERQAKAQAATRQTRLEALRLAMMESVARSDEQIVARAQAFLNFLNGKEGA